jgi:Ku70/Ku80 beta-barrel domain
MAMATRIAMTATAVTALTAPGGTGTLSCVTRSKSGAQSKKAEPENIALDSTRTIEIDEFVPKADIDPRYLIRPYYFVPDGKVGHDAFTVIRETIRSMNRVAIGRVVLTSREHIIGLEPLKNGPDGHVAALPL